MKPVTVVLSCEHAVNTVPQELMYLFSQETEVLETHRALDIGAHAIIQHISEAMGINYMAASVTRLLIDCNRSLKKPACFSKYSNHLSVDEKQQLVDRYYLPYRKQVEASIQMHIANGYQVLHVSMHSFTPILDGVVRNAGIGLLYDYHRHGEKEVARIWRGLLIHRVPFWRIRMNYPYHGESDSLTSALRKSYAERDYLGLEIECNQALMGDEAVLTELKENLSSSLQELLEII